MQVGRTDNNDLILPDVSVSRRHAMFSPDGNGAWKVADQNSANGVLVNGEFINEARLKNNDEIAIGEFTLRYEAVDARPVHTGGTDLPSRLTLVMSRKEVELALGQKFAAPERHSPVETQSRESGPATGVSERRENFEQRLRTLEHENQLLTLLYQVSRALGELATVDDVVARVLELVLQIEGVERGYAMLLDEKGAFLPAVVRYRNVGESSNAPQMILSQSVIKQVMENGEPLVVQDASADERFQSSESIVISGMQSAMCAPLRSNEKNFGLLYVDNLSKRGMFTKDDLNVFAVIAAQAGLAIDHVRAKKEVAQQIIQLSALERFLSPGVARKIAAEAADLKLGGENQKLTVLFADIRGFTTMAEAMRPEQVVEILNEYFKVMSDLIFEHEGTLDKYLGDGLMALFGAPFSKGDDAMNAVRTAIEMQTELAELNRRIEAQALNKSALSKPPAGTSPRAPLRMGIGIHTGPAIVGYMGTARRLDYTAIGDTVNTASRLTTNAEPDQILISAATFAELGGRVAARPLEAIRVKGRSAAVDVLEVEWKGSAS